MFEEAKAVPEVLANLAEKVRSATEGQIAQIVRSAEIRIRQIYATNSNQGRPEFLTRTTVFHEEHYDGKGPSYLQELF